MKRFLTILLAALLVAAVLCVPASAAKYEPAAKELNAIGVFKGTGDGFELDKIPNRAQAAVMLVRLFGAEETAQTDFTAGTITSPFEDVSWDAPYVAWLYAKGLTKGVSEKEFGSALPCSAHDYVVFMLRTLGYKDGEDFTYADAETFAAQKGFYSPLLILGDFKRDDLVAVTYQALATQMKDGGGTLLEKLVKDGAVDEKAAQAMLDKFSLFAKLNELVGKTDTMDADMKVTMTASTVESGVIMTIPASLEGSIKIASQENDFLQTKAALLFKAAAMEEEIGMNMWIREGWIYLDLVVSTEEGPEELKFKMDMSPMLEMMEEADASSLMANDGSLMLPFFKSIKVRETSTDTLYECVLNGDAIEGISQDILELIGMAEGTTISVDDVNVVYKLRADKLLSMSEAINMTVGVETPTEDGGTESTEVSIKMDISMDINSLDHSVTISFPDFSDYIDLGADLEDMIALGATE